MRLTPFKWGSKDGRICPSLFFNVHVSSGCQAELITVTATRSRYMEKSSPLRPSSGQMKGMTESLDAGNISRRALPRMIASPRYSCSFPPRLRLYTTANVSYSLLTIYLSVRHSVRSLDIYFHLASTHVSFLPPRRKNHF